MSNDLPPPTTSNGTASTNPAREPDYQLLFDHTLHHLLSLWPPLSLAVTNSWGGPLSQDKLDWLAGTLSDMMCGGGGGGGAGAGAATVRDADDVADVLLQVMADEFETVVEDESEEGVAGDVMRAWTEILVERRTGFADEVRRRWEGRRGRAGAGTGPSPVAGYRDGGEVVEEVEVVEEEEDGEEGTDGDEEMGDAPELVNGDRQGMGKGGREEPEVDEEGFTMVKRKCRR